MQILQPPEWAKPRGYSNGIVARGRTVFLAGQFGCNAVGKFDTSDFAGQARQSLKNIVAILAEAGAGPEHICRLNWYVADRKEYIGLSLKPVTGAQVSPLSSLLNSPCGEVPAYHTPGSLA